MRLNLLLPLLQSQHVFAYSDTSFVACLPSFARTSLIVVNATTSRNITIRRDHLLSPFVPVEGSHNVMSPTLILTNTILPQRPCKWTGGLDTLKSIVGV